MDLGWLLPDLRLGNPWALLAWPALLVWWLYLRARRRGRGGLTFPHAQLTGGLPKSWRVRLSGLPDLLRLLTLALLIAALARPQLGRQRERINQKGVDIMLALDVSGSMRAEDIPPDRLAVAKRTIRRFVARLRTDRVGLVVFAGRSFTQCPLTTDYQVVVDLLDECHIGMVRFDGTAVGEALANCVYRFENESRRRMAATGASQADEARRSRVVVLLTDGFNNTGRVMPDEAAAMARVKNIRVHCIGLGTVEGAPVPWFYGGQRRFLTNPDGSLLITRLDEQTLQDIARTTGGQYFRATDAAALDRIYQRIAEMEKHEIEIEKITHHEERYLIPLAAALALLLFELLLRSTALRVMT